MEMAELLPEFEPLKPYEEDGCLLAKTNPRRHLVMQLNIWSQSVTAYIGVTKKTT